MAKTIDFWEGRKIAKLYNEFLVRLRNIEQEWILLLEVVWKTLIRKLSSVISQNYNIIYLNGEHEKVNFLAKIGIQTRELKIKERINLVNKEWRIVVSINISFVTRGFDKMKQ